MQLLKFCQSTLEYLIDVPPLISFSIFFHPGHFYSNRLPGLFIMGESFQLRQILSNNILMLTFLRFRKGNGLSVLCFRFLSSCKEPNTLCFVLYVSIKSQLIANY